MGLMRAVRLLPGEQKNAYYVLGIILGVRILQEPKQMELTLLRD